jgi:diguanylate cyclase (GGDEF)-like protein
VLLKKIFNEEYFVLEVDYPKEVIEKVKSTKLEVIILDDKTQFALDELCKEIRLIPSSKNVPILIVSNNLKRSYLKQLVTAGANDFLHEPLDQEAIHDRIESVIKKYSMQQKLGPLALGISKQPPHLNDKKLCSSRVSIHDTALQEIRRALEAKQSISLLMINIDQITKVQQRWGALAAEELLTSIEAHLVKHARAQDVCLPATQERFILVLPKTSQTAAKLLAETIEESFKNRKFTTYKGAIRLTISIGVVSLSETDDPATDAYDYLQKMLKTGEQHLEKAKKIGQRIVSN